MLLAARARLAKAGFTGPAGPQRAVLVGGGAVLPGARDIATEALGMPVRIGGPFDLCGFEHGEAGPQFACAAGLLRWRFDNPTLADVDETFQPSLRQAADALRGAAGRAWGWLRENF
jgi:cell division protein FtsA